MKHANDFLYKCNHCDLTFPNSWSLAYHRKKIHGQTGQGDANSTTKIPREDYRIPCRDCDEVLPNKTALYKHRKKEHSDMTSSLAANNEPTTVWCGACGAQFNSRVALDAHTRSHTSTAVTASVASCAKCGDSFAHISDLHKHVDSAQCRRRAHACPVCARSFRSASVRDEHLRTHTGERPFPCDVCGLAFRRLTAMRNHRLIHTGVRAWACERCPKRFRIRSDLRTHARLKHPAHLAVIEIRGLNPTSDEVMEYLNANNISHTKVIEITKMSFAKGTSSIIPNCARALSMLGSVPRTQVTYSKPVIDDSDFQPPRRGRGIAKHPRRPKILQRGADDAPPPPQEMFPVTLNVTGGELTDMDVQLLLRDGVLVNGNQMVQLQLDDNMLLE
ncbi:zinc finger protein 90-like [Ostrinia furnacalis]|uniref:zinc finger protein 90-like n=1 Tax=Ostrinia furnacalis TaxID=93504 RepID=UPI00103DA99C|nr:zinc finger protein 90-like [Ostrinia furnacalis]